MINNDKHLHVYIAYMTFSLDRGTIGVTIYMYMCTKVLINFVAVLGSARAKHSNKV